MMQYKTKIEQLKQEKSSLSITYEVYICHVGLVHRCDPTDICERDILYRRNCNLILGNLLIYFNRAISRNTEVTSAIWRERI